TRTSMTSTSTGTAGRTPAARPSTPPPWGPTRRSPLASSRTTRAAGCITATSSPTRTVGWRAGTWSSPRHSQEETLHDVHPHRRSRPCRGARRAGRRDGAVPAAVKADDPEGAEGTVPHADRVQARLQVQDDPVGGR